MNMDKGLKTYQKASTANIIDLTGETSTPDDIVVTLLNTPFQSLPTPQQYDIVKRGRPTPNIHEVRVGDGSTIKRAGLINFYPRYPWMTASERLKRFYCWPCLLFSTVKTALNSFEGYYDTGQKQVLKIHEATHEHGASILKVTEMTFKSRGQLIVMTSKVDHQKYETCRDALRRCVDDICEHVISGKSILTFREPAEVDLLKFNSSTMNMIIESIENCIINSISKELRDVKFVAIILDEVTDLSLRSRTGLTLRYFLDGVTYERFCGFFEKLSVAQLEENVKQVLVKILSGEQNLKKLIAITTDGDISMTDPVNSIRNIISSDKKFHNCFAHSVISILSKSISKIYNCRMFFATCKQFAQFFQKTVPKNEVLLGLVVEVVPNLSKPDPSIPTLIVTRIYENLSDIKRLLDQITEDPTLWDATTLFEVSTLKGELNNFEFIFLLELFFKLFKYTNEIFAILGSISYSKEVYNSRVQMFNDELKRIKCSDFQIIFAKSCDFLVPPEKDVKDSAKYLGIDSGLYITLYEFIVESVINITNFRIAAIANTNFVELLNSSKFSDYRQDFPLSLVHSFSTGYITHFVPNVLKRELNHIYHSDIFQGKSVMEIYSIFENSEFKETFPEVYNLLHITFTIPSIVLASSAQERYLDRIENHCRNNYNELQMNSVKENPVIPLRNGSIMEIERKYLKQIFRNDNFHDFILSDFCRLSGRVELIKLNR